jgi:AcrR family transcriptional regulator
VAADNSPTGSSAGRGSASRRELAVARVVDPARERAETRVQAFLDAALELINSTSGQDFTVQEVIERSGQSLRSFYQYFDGKYELLLALFEDSVRTAAAQLAEVVEVQPTAVARLHCFAVEYYRICQPAVSKARSSKRGFAPAFANFAQQLLTEHPQEASKAFLPLTEMLDRLLGAADAEGAIRSGLDHRRIAGVVLESLMFNAFAATISGVSVHPDEGDPAEQLWDMLFHGLASNAG